jgi:hypothetical protein
VIASTNSLAYLASLTVTKEKGFLTLTPGRLKSGKLHGLVVINGVLSNDPKSRHCSEAMYDGLGFIGYFEDGVPKGANVIKLFSSYNKIR